MSELSGFVARAFRERHSLPDFEAGIHPVPVTGKVFGEARTPQSLKRKLRRLSVGVMHLWLILDHRQTYSR